MSDEQRNDPMRALMGDQLGAQAQAMRDSLGGGLSDARGGLLNQMGYVNPFSGYTGQLRMDECAQKQEPPKPRVLPTVRYCSQCGERLTDWDTERWWLRVAANVRGGLGFITGAIAGAAVAIWF